MRSIPYIAPYTIYYAGALGIKIVESVISANKKRD